MPYTKEELLEELGRQIEQRQPKRPALVILWERRHDEMTHQFPGVDIDAIHHKLRAAKRNTRARRRKP